jgi:alpha-D-ribose 1-methylphosphonate 5-triphosphate diphosphatase
MGALKLAEVWSDLPRGIASVTSTPAMAVGLQDRGCLQIGLRADIIRFSIMQGTPVLNGTWHAGQQVA